MSKHRFFVTLLRLFSRILLIYQTFLHRFLQGFIFGYLNIGVAWVCLDSLASLSQGQVWWVVDTVWIHTCCHCQLKFTFFGSQPKLVWDLITTLHICHHILVNLLHLCFSEMIFFCLFHFEVVIYEHLFELLIWGSNASTQTIIFHLRKQTLSLHSSLKHVIILKRHELTFQSICFFCQDPCNFLFIFVHSFVISPLWQTFKV